MTPSLTSVALSEQAYEHACARRPNSRLCGEGIAAIWAEAEALIRTGWSP